MVAKNFTRHPRAGLAGGPGLRWEIARPLPALRAAASAPETDVPHLPALLRRSLLLALSAGPAVAMTADTGTVLAQQWADYQAVKPKSVIDLQPYRQETTAPLAAGGSLRFISLNPNVNAWFLAMISPADGGDVQAYHIENPDPAGQTVALVPGAEPTLALGGKAGAATCDPWAGSPSAFATAQDSGVPFAPICNGRLYLRNRSEGAQSTLESVTDFLRNNIWGGDAVVNFVKDTFYQDAFAQKAKLVSDSLAAPDAGPGAAAVAHSDGAPPAVAARTGFTLTGTQNDRMEVGAWYPVSNLPGVYASALEPGLIAPSVLNGPGRTNALDPVESSAIDYFVAFDLSKFNLGYAVGTVHPAVDWSPRPPDNMQNASLPGPDGIGNVAPLVRLGMVEPALAPFAVATFAAGFKREHGAFHRGPLSEVNNGSHYGFVEEGTILSKLQPQLSTLYALADGTIGMKTWTDADNALLPNIRFARQNGVPLLETDPATGLGVPGPYVVQWIPGNWSGSAEAQLRTLRAGICLKVTPTTRYLIYGWFSTVTPSGMARSFQAYGCAYAMQLDMNAIEHTYLAVYVRQGGQVQVEHVVASMGKLDRHADDGTVLPRFVAFPDSRDLFYLTRKN